MTGSLQPYPVYRPSGVEWLGHVPEHWGVQPIKTLFRELDERSRDGDGELLSLTRLEGLVPQNRTSVRVARAENLLNYKVCHSNDLVMNRMQAWSGMFAVSRLDGLVSPDYSLFRAVEPCSVKYFEYLFKTPLLVGQFAKESKGIGSGFNRLYTDDFGCVPATVPPPSEQAAIVRYLDHADRRIQSYIRAKRKLIGLLEEQKQAVIHQAVTRGLDPDVRLKPSGVEWLGDVPEHWKMVRLRGHASNVTDQTREVDPDEPYVSLEHVQSWTGLIREAITGGATDSQLKRFRAGDILFGKLRPYLAKVARAKCSGVCVGEFLVLRLHGRELSASYVEHVLRSRPVIDAVNASTFGAKMPRADWRFVGHMTIPLPPRAEQAAIVSHLDHETTHMDAARDRAQREIELLREYRTRLMADVVTGKLDVRAAAADLPESDETDVFDILDIDDVAEHELAPELEEVAT